MDIAKRLCHVSRLRRAVRSKDSRKISARGFALNWRVGTPAGVGIPKVGETRTPEFLLADLGKLFSNEGINCLSSMSADWFARAEKSTSKGLRLDEFKSSMESNGFTMTDEEATSLFKHFDTDGSGHITYGEFAKGLAQDMPAFSASLAFMHQYTGHYPSVMSAIKTARPSFDPLETDEWLESLEMVVKERGLNRTRFLLHELMEEAARQGVYIAPPVVMPMINTIPSSGEPPYPGDLAMESKISDVIRWNAAVMVSDANRRGGGVGGHIGTFASICDVYEVGMNHFFRGKDYGGGQGDSIWFQGHAAPGAYARAFVEGRLSIDQVMNFRRESGGNGLSSYPHPRLMPDFWENPTVSMDWARSAQFTKQDFFDTFISVDWLTPRKAACGPSSVMARAMSLRQLQQFQWLAAKS
jgi:hypothetical protein